MRTAPARDRSNRATLVSRFPTRSSTGFVQGGLVIRAKGGDAILSAAEPAPRVALSGNLATGREVSALEKGWFEFRA